VFVKLSSSFQLPVMPFATTFDPNRRLIVTRAWGCGVVLNTGVAGSQASTPFFPGTRQRGLATRR